MTKIRKFKEKDEEQIKSMIKTVLTEIFGNFGIRKWEDFKDYDIVYIAEDKEKIIGSAALKSLENKTGKLKRMYIHKEYRNKGIGKKLLKKIENFAIKNKLNRIVLSTSDIQLKPAFEFYKKNGFKEITKVDLERDFQDLKNENVNLSETKFMEKLL